MAEVPWHLVLDDIGKRSEALKRKKTNADRIRAMTDEELAEWLSNHSMLCVPGKRPNPEDCVGGCEHCWLDWLRQEAKDGKTAL